jgi:uncharacterized protein YjbI with pentapeptide repeats
MTDQTGIEWPICDEDGCIGVSLGVPAKCIAHAPDEDRNATLKQLGETGEIDVRGVPITQALLEQILAAAPHGAEDHPTFRTVRFDWATFQGKAVFRGATFQGKAVFQGATFQRNAGFDAVTFRGEAVFRGATLQGKALFRGATFESDAVFRGATFQGDAGFDGATFQGNAVFAGAIFPGDAGFYEATFQGDALFAGAIFRGDAVLRKATFQGDAWFEATTFQRDAVFAGAIFQDDAAFRGATFRRDAEFSDARFEQARQLGPLLVYAVLRMDGTYFAQPILIEASARGLSCQRTRFPAGAQFRLRGAQIVLDDADLPSPSILMGIAALSDARLARREQRLVQAVRRLAPQAAAELSERPRLLSLQGANVAGLGLCGVELADCRFGGAHNLDKLRVEADVSFAIAPVRLGWDWRQVIAEERALRAQCSGRWTKPLWPAWANDEPAVRAAGQIAELYRALRKGREDAKDEPGAADFYYGEMEMRRRPRCGDTTNGPGVPSRGRVERGILIAYWLVSGYGLRAWRALACLVAAVIVAAVTLRAVGFTHHRHQWSSAFLYTAGAVTHLVNPPDGLLTEPGQAIRIVIGLLGPVLLGLALLALRGRVKR